VVPDPRHPADLGRHRRALRRDGFLQWFHYVDPLASPTPVPVRLAYLALALAGGAIHVSAAYREKFGVARTFLLWSAGMALACVLMIVLAD
jgi:hypothetical protein